MTDTLASPKVATLLARLFAQSDADDPALLARIGAEADSRYGGQRYVPQLAPLFDQAFLPVPPEVGQLLYAVIRANRPRRVVEIGTSFGVSAIHIAAALRDNGTGALVSAELSPVKADAARKHLTEAGLGDLVEIRLGDAAATLADLEPGIDILFLDGWKDSYLTLLQSLEPKLRPGALVIGDDTKLFPERLARYLSYMRDPTNGYRSVDLPIGDGVEFSVRL